MIIPLLLSVLVRILDYTRSRTDHLASGDNPAWGDVCHPAGAEDPGSCTAPGRTEQSKSRWVASASPRRSQTPEEGVPPDSVWEQVPVHYRRRFLLSEKDTPLADCSRLVLARKFQTKRHVLHAHHWVEGICLLIERLEVKLQVFDVRGCSENSSNHLLRDQTLTDYLCYLLSFKKVPFHGTNIQGDQDRHPPSKSGHVHAPFHNPGSRIEPGPV